MISAGYTVLEPTWDGRQWSCSVFDNRTLAVVATTHGVSLSDAECKAIGAAMVGNECRASREGRAGA